MAMSQDFSKYQDGEPPTSDVHGEDVIISPDTQRENRLPPGQIRTRKWPVLHWKTVPSVTTETWSLTVGGLVANELSYSWEEFQKLPRTKVFSDFHCVTRWSRLGNLWEGVSVREIMDRAGVSPEANFVIAHGFDDGFTTNIPLHEFAAEDALLVDLHDGEPIHIDHGGPVRLVIPRLYAWKSAKWLSRLEFVASDAPGYWERCGYHNHGDPWTEQRYSDDF